MIEIKNLHKFYGNDEILKGIDAEISDGEIFAIVGHSGAGKSTLLRCINGLESYQEGNLIVNGEEVKALSEGRLREFRKNIGMIFQNFALMNQKTVAQNIALPMEIWKFEKAKIKKKVSELLEIVGLSGKADVYPKSLSGGQKQRVAIARALALNPKILLSDEATSALDPNITKQILELLKKINEELGITIVLVTHEMEVVKSIAARALLLSGGKVVNYGKTHELFLKPDASMVEFLGEKPILPSEGVNIGLYFPKEVAFNSVITQMARDLDINLNIVWGKIEKLNDLVLGHLVINIEPKYEKIVLEYIQKTGVLWEKL